MVQITQKFKEIEFRYALFLIMLGIILIFTSRTEQVVSHNIISGILEFLGTTLISIFSVSILYDVFIAQKHFDDFKLLLTDELKELESIQSMCMKLGIIAIFETRDDYERKYPLMSIIEQQSEKAELYFIGKSLFNLINKRSVFENGLKKGLKFNLACINPKELDKCLMKDELYDSDIGSVKTGFKSLIDWSKENNVSGSIQLKYLNVNILDTVSIFIDENKEKLIWDLSFGRDLQKKKVIVLDTERPLGADLKSRYLKIYECSEKIIELKNGNIELNKLDETPGGLET